jgi:methylglutaconyl-CoA hydratase
MTKRVSVYPKPEADSPATSTDSDSVLMRRHSDGVVWINLNRPHAANSRNQFMRNALMTIYGEVADDVDVRCVVLTGCGDRYFCASMDLKEAGDPETVTDRRERLRSSRDIEMLAQLRTPTSAAINGFALRAGWEMALACDLRIMAEEAEIGLPEITHKLVPVGGGTRRLPRLIGSAQAFEMVYLRAPPSGSEAEAAGLVNRAVSGSELVSTVSEFASNIASHDRTALIAAKRADRTRTL